MDNECRDGHIGPPLLAMPPKMSYHRPSLSKRSSPYDQNPWRLHSCALLQAEVRLLRLLLPPPSGGPDGESAAAMRYLSQRYSMKNAKIAGVLTDIGTEELEP